MKKPPLAIMLIIAAYLALALAYSVVVPPFEGLDEIEHFGVTRYVADTGQLPVQGDPSLAAYYIHQEASQPPLYYLLAGPFLRATGISTANTASHLIPNPYVTCGAESIRADKATLRHDPFVETFPWRTALLALHLLRALSVVLEAFTVAGVYAIARRVFPHGQGVALLAAALTAFNPQFLIVGSGVNNDNIATPVITWAVYLAIVVLEEGLVFRRALALGALIGLGALSKLTGLLLMPLAALVVVADLKSQTPALRGAKGPLWAGASVSNLKSAIQQIGNLAMLVGAPLIIAGWWYIRNWQLYGDPTGLAPMLDIVGRRGPMPPGLALSELGLVFRSYWGQFPCAFFDSTWYYWAWGVIVVLGLAGLVLGLRRERATTRVAPYLLATWWVLVFIGWVRWNMTTPAPGGRLLFSAVGATSTLLAFGLTSLFSLLRPRSTLFAYIGSTVMAGVGLLALLVWVRPLFAPPPMLDATRIKPQYSLDARFGESIALFGYDLRADDLGPGRYVDVTLYWRALQPIPVDYVLAIQLAALAPGDTRTLLNFNTWPGGGNLPTTAWPVGPVSVDRYRVPLPLDTGTTQAWRLQALLYDAKSDTRLPLALNAQPAGEALTLRVVRVAGIPQAAPSLPDSARLAAPVTFDQAVVLTHAQVDSQADRVRVRLLWQSLAPLPRDVTVFVHAYDAADYQVAAGDGPPMNGGFPTSLWQKGDQVLDEHSLTLPPGLTLDAVRVTVGLYQPENGARLTAIANQNSVRLPSDESIIWTRR